MRKGIFLLVATISMIFMISCGDAGNHEDGSGAVVPPPGAMNLTFTLPNGYVGAQHYCQGVSAGTNLNWPAPGTGAVFVDNGAGASDLELLGVLPGDYICNVQTGGTTGTWQAALGTSLVNMDVTAGVNVYTLTANDTITNGIGGGNWTFTLGADGTISCLVNCGGVNPPVCDPLNPPATVDLTVVFKSYQNLGFVPRVRFAGDGFVEHVMTQLSPSLFTYTYTAVPTDQLYTVNFKNPLTDDHLFDNLGPTGPYVVSINALQVSELLDDDILVELDICGIPLVQYSDLDIVWTPANPAVNTVQMVFGQGGFSLFTMIQSGGNWTAAMPYIAPGRYEVNLSYLPDQGLPNMAVWPNYINGTITINGTVMSVNFIVDYGQPVSWPDPTNPNMIYHLESMLVFDLLPNGSVVGVNLGDPVIEVIIPIP